MFYFLRWTSDPQGDIKRNFSGHMQAWFNSKEEAYKDYEEEKLKGRYLPFEPKYDPVEDMWNSDPEWGVSGYLFSDEKTLNEALEKIKDIEWHHKETMNQDLGVFSANEIGPYEGYDGEELFRDISFIGYIDIDDSPQDILKKINLLKEIRSIVKSVLRNKMNSPDLST